MAKEIGRKVDEEFGINLHEKINENKFFWKEVKKARSRGVNMRIKGEDGVHERDKVVK